MYYIDRKANKLNNEDGGLIKMKNNEELLSMKMVAEKFGVTPITIKNWVYKYELPHHKTAGGHFIFTESQVEAVREMLLNKFGLAD